MPDSESQHDQDAALRELEAESARIQRSLRRDMTRLRELKWMFIFNLLPFVPLIVLAMFWVDYDLLAKLCTYSVAVAIGLSGWGVFRSVNAWRDSKYRAIFIPYTLMFGFTLFLFIFILPDVRNGGWYESFHPYHMPKK